MSTATARKRLAIFGRFLLALTGSAVCLLVSAVFISMVDAWFASGRFALPFSPTDEPIAELGFLGLAALTATSASLAISTIPLILLKRESLVAYLVLCGAPPFALLVLPATEGTVIVFACAAMITAAFWWFTYRRSRRYEGTVPVRIAWLALLVGVITFAGMFWSEHRAEQIASSEREQAMMEPAHWMVLSLATKL